MGKATYAVQCPPAFVLGDAAEAVEDAVVLRADRDRRDAVVQVVDECARS